MLSRLSFHCFLAAIALLAGFFVTAPASAQYGYGYPSLQDGPSYGHAGPRYYRPAPITYGRAPTYGYNQTRFYGEGGSYNAYENEPPVRYRPYYPSARGHYRAAPRPRYATTRYVPVRSTRYVTVMKPVTHVVAVRSYRRVTTWQPVTVRKTVIRYQPVKSYRRAGYHHHY